jgi:hypothetical protein
MSAVEIKRGSKHLRVTITLKTHTNKYTGCFITLSVITNIYNKKTKGPTLMELFTATGKLKRFFDNQRGSMCAPRVTRHTSIQYLSSCHTRVFRHGSLQQWRLSMHSCWRVCGKNLNIVSMCAVSPVVHTSNISSCQKKLFQFSCSCEKFH